MNLEQVKGFFKKYWPYILGGGALLYLVYKNSAGSTRQADVTGANANALELAKLQAQSAGVAGSQELERERIAAELEAAKAKAAQDALNAQNQLALQNRALDIQQAALQGQIGLAGAVQTSSILQSLAAIAANALKAATGSQSQKSGASGGASAPGASPSTAGRTASTTIPKPAVPKIGPVDNFAIPDFSNAPLPEPSFSPPGTTFDSGLTFNDQGPPADTAASEPSPKTESELPEISTDWSDYYDVPVGGGWGGAESFRVESDVGGGDYA